MAHVSVKNVMNWAALTFGTLATTVAAYTHHDSQDQLQKINNVRDQAKTEQLAAHFEEATADLTCKSKASKIVGLFASCCLSLGLVGLIDGKAPARKQEAGNDELPPERKGNTFRNQM